MKLFSFLIITAVILTACTSVPLTNRKQLAFLPESQLMSMSEANYAQVKSESKVLTGTKEAEMITRVGKKMQFAVETYLKEIDQAGMVSQYQWEFSLIESDQANAWAMPGGKVAFYTGILPICETEAGVAVVMGHEIAHVIAKHGNERMSQAMFQQAGSFALDKLLEDKPEQTKGLFQMAYGMGTNLAVSLPFSRLHESEADEMGLIFMAIAGYNPSEAESFWKRMAKDGGQTPPEFLSTHPNPENRAKKLKELQPKAMEYYKKYNK
jgi:predicted Zn-dependent protease